MVIDLQAKKEAREARLKAKADMIKAQQGFAEPEESVTPAPEAEPKALASEAKGKKTK
jgi:hypothetical protein